MKLLTTICIPALMLGAAALSTPCHGPGASRRRHIQQRGAAAPAQPAQDANSAAVPAQTAANATQMQSTSLDAPLRETPSWR